MLDGIISFARTLGRAGWSVIVAYVTMFATIGVLIVAMVHPSFIANQWTENSALIVLLGMVGNLLYRSLRETRSVEFLDKSGIIGAFPNVDDEGYRKLMSCPGEKVVFNVWLHNFDSLARLLTEALKSDRTNVHLSILSQTSDFASVRAKELNRDVARAIRNNEDEISQFLNSLSPTQVSRVHVYSFEEAPKVALHSSGDKAFVSIYWPGHHAVDGPQIQIEGRRGFFAKRIWDYYDSLELVEITDRLLQKGKMGA